MSTATPFSQVHHAKTATIITALVLVLHALVGMALLHMPAISLKPLTTITPPLELAFVTPPMAIIAPTDAAKSAKSPMTDIQPTPVKPIYTANHKPHLANPPSPAKTVLPPVNSKPRMATHQLTPTTTKTSVIKPKPLKPTTTDKAMADKPIVNKVAKSNSTSAKPIDSAPIESFANKVAPDPDVERLAQQSTIAQADTEQFEKAQAAHEQTAKEQGNNIRIAQAPWQQDKTEEGRAEKVKAEPTKAAQHSPQQSKKLPIQTSDPISLNAGDTKWQTKPNIMLTRSLSALGKRKHITNMTVRVSFSANGDITGVSIVQSSGEAQIDTYLQRQVMKGKLYPYTFDGHAVAGTFILPISINYLN